MRREVSGWLGDMLGEPVRKLVLLEQMARHGTAAVAGVLDPDV